MDIGIPVGLSTWEAVAALQVVQTLDATIWCPSKPWKEDTEIAALTQPTTDKICKQLFFGDAYRKVENGKKFYGDVLLETNKLGEKLKRLSLPLAPSESGDIILCPYAIKTDMEVPLRVWGHIVRFLRTYDLPVRLIADQGQRLEGPFYFSEDEIMSEKSLPEKLHALANARVIVGVPNAWTWLATAWDKKMIVLYPDNVELHRWMPYDKHDDGGIPYLYEGCFRLRYDTHKIQMPLMLSGIRKLMSFL